MPDSPWLTTREAAAYLRLSPKSLEALRARTPPQGPPFVKPLPHMVRYRQADLDAWMAGTAQSNTDTQAPTLPTTQERTLALVATAKRGQRKGARHG